MSWSALFKAELKSVFFNPAIVFTVFGGIIIYSLLYPLPYSNQLPRELKGAIVDHDTSQQSRQFARMIDATPQIEIQRNLPTLASAKPLVNSGDIQGIIVIPEHFYRDLLLGKSPVISVAGDASFFLIYSSVAEGVAAAGNELGGSVKIERKLAAGKPLSLAAEQNAPFGLNLVPVFNPTMGYGNYVVPAVFMLILQQTLLIASGLLGCSQKPGLINTNGSPDNNYWSKISVSRLMFTRYSVLLAIYCVMSMYYLGGAFEYYGISRLAHPWHLAAVMLPFLLATTSIGMIIGALISRAEAITLTVLLSSMPLLFVAGFIWPSSALPDWLNALAQLAPSTPIIQSTLKLNQMGASFQAIAPELSLLWCQAICYALIAALMMKKKAQLTSD